MRKQISLILYYFLTSNIDDTFDKIGQKEDKTEQNKPKTMQNKPKTKQNNAKQVDFDVIFS